MAADILFKQGDTQPSFTDRLAYGDGSVPPLENATVVLRLRSLANATLTVLTGAVHVQNPNTGEVYFTPSGQDTAVPGNYLAEWVVTFDPDLGLGQQTFPTEGFIWVAVEPNLGSLGQKLIELGDVKKILNIGAGDHTRDTDLLSMIDAITPLIEQEVGPVVPRVYEEWFDGGSNIADVIRQPSSGFGSNPLFELISASEYRGPIEYPLALVASPVFGQIYSVFVNLDMGTITRRTAGGRTVAFMPGRESIHVWYRSGQTSTPPNVYRAALEACRIGYRWGQQTGRGSLSPSDAMEMSAAMGPELSRMIRTWCKPTKRFPSIA